MHKQIETERGEGGRERGGGGGERGGVGGGGSRQTERGEFREIDR